MSNSRRVQLQPGYILHRRPFRDSSQILDLVTQDFGKISVVARGSRGAKSRLGGVLRPFLPLRVSWVAKSSLGTLTGAEATGTPLGVVGDAMFSAYYVNELLLHFLHSDDPQPEIFGLYQDILNALVSSSRIAAHLRSFEIEFLSLLGYALNLDRSADGLRSVSAEQTYEYRVEQGPVEVARTTGTMVFTGAQLAGIAAQRFDEAEILRAANRLLRAVIDFHLGGKELKSRKVLKELHKGRIAAP